MTPTFDPSTAKPVNLPQPVCGECSTRFRLFMATNPRANQRQPFWICAAAYAWGQRAPGGEFTVGHCRATVRAVLATLDGDYSPKSPAISTNNEQKEADCGRD